MRGKKTIENNLPLINKITALEVRKTRKVISRKKLQSEMSISLELLTLGS